MRIRAKTILTGCLVLSCLLVGFVEQVSDRASAQSWIITTVDEVGKTGLWSSIDLDSHGWPHISYYYETGRSLRYAKWNGTGWETETVDSSGDVGQMDSMALDRQDRPHISYFDGTNLDLKYAWWNGTGWNISTVDAPGTTGGYTSLALDSLDRPHISYYNWTSSDLRYARWTGSAWTLSTVDSTGDVGQDASMDLDGSDNPHISYFDGMTGHLKYAVWNGSSWNTSTVDNTNGVGTHTSIALDNRDYAHISYLDYARSVLKYASWNGGGWETEVVDSQSNVGRFTSLSLDRNGEPHISYFDWSNIDLKYAYRNGTVWSIERVDGEGWNGAYSSLVLDSNDSPHISYYDSSYENLKYARRKVNTPPDTPSIPAGSILCEVGTVYTYMTSAIDQDGDRLNYTFDWGDGSQSQVGPFDSGAVASGQHIWSLPARYSVSVKAVDTAQAASSWSNQLEVTAGKRPSAPLTLVASSGPSQIMLTWSAPSDGGGLAVTGYRIYRGLLSGSETYLNGIGAILHYEDKSLTVGQTYYYEVAAKNDIGEGARSNEASAKAINIPEPPMEVVALAGDGHVLLTWEPPIDDGGSPISNYSIYRGFASGLEVLHETVENRLSYEDAGLVNGQTYYYMVSSWNDAGEGLRSAEVNATPFTVPGPPSELRATAGDGFVVLSWNAPASSGGSPVVSYKIYRGTTSGNESYLTIVGSVLTYTDAGLVNGQAYYYRVAAVNLAGEGIMSEEVSGKPTVPPQDGGESMSTSLWFWLLLVLVVMLIAVLVVRRRRKARS